MTRLTIDSEAMTEVASRTSASPQRPERKGPGASQIYGAGRAGSPEPEMALFQARRGGACSKIPRERNVKTADATSPPTEAEPATSAGWSPRTGAGPQSHAPDRNKVTAHSCPGWCSSPPSRSWWWQQPASGLTHSCHAGLAANANTHRSCKTSKPPRAARQALNGDEIGRIGTPSKANPEGHTAPCSGHDAAHVHGPGCGHEAVPHGDHVDYLVDGRLHHPHGDHCDDHGKLELA